MSAPNRNRLTFELSDELLEAVTAKAAATERTLSGQIRHSLNLDLGLSDEEPPRDTTPELPLS